jgi:hypothetical protein
VVRSWSLVLALALAVLAACGGNSPRAPGPLPKGLSGPRAVAARGTVTSNVRRADYAGSAACAVCHADLARAFARAPMRTMTRVPDGGALVHAPFDGTVFHFKDESVTLETKGGARWVHVDTGRQRQSYRVTRVIGGRVREDFAGSGADGGEERVLPISYLIAKKTLRYKGYSVMVRERAHMADGAVWNQTCIFCHNTTPYLLSLLGALSPRPAAYQGVMVDRLLPPERKWTYEITDDQAFARAVSDEVLALGGEVDGSSARKVTAQGIAETRARFGGKHTVDVGIGCEACHGGSREHAKDPSLRPTFLPTSPFVRVREETTRAEQITHACARCHQVLFSRYPWTWEGGRRDGARLGGSNINSGEARDLLLGGCAKGLSCPACHDPHAKDGHAREDAVSRPSGNGVCTGCHAKYAGKQALSAHTHHAPDGEAGACIACHMPKKNMSLSSGLTRYHRIGSPTDPMRVMLDRPLECALCHADKTVEQVVSDMERLWGKHYERDTLRALYGALDANVLLATAELGKPHEQAVALAVLGRGGPRRTDALPVALGALTHAYPLVREYARDAVEAITGHPCPVDVSLPVDRIREAARNCGEFSHLPGLPAQRPHEIPPEPPRDDPDDGED